MSSVERAPAQIPINKLYINTGMIQSSIYDGTSNLTRAAWVENLNPLTLSTAGAAVLRDMGKSVYLPGVAGASQSTVLRKIQLVPSGLLGTYGTGGASGTEGTEFFTGYISIGGQTFGGGDGTPAAVARLN